jgi:hypothetical protein
MDRMTPLENPSAFRSRRRALTAALSGGLGLAACAGPGPAPTASPVPSATGAAGFRLSLPGLWAWFDGRRVAYVSTDVSDAGMAAAMGLNFVPRLAEVLEQSSAGGFGGPVERVYAFAGNEQINVFASAPEPAGAGNTNAAYSPLWRMVRVHWLPGAARRELRSGSEVLDAAEARAVRLEVTGVVVNCPVLRSADGKGLPGLV